jgi:hypothetical protein
VAVRFGDVIAIPTARGLALAQYTHKAKLYGALIRVLDGFWPDLSAAAGSAAAGSVAAAASAQTAFWTFFPVNAALKKGLVEKVGHAEIPEAARAFPLMRKRGQIAPGPGGRVLDWWLWDGDKEWKIGALSPGQEELSLAEVVNDTLLIERIESGWRPRDIH